MLVKELIARLQALDPDAAVNLEIGVWVVPLATISGFVDSKAVLLTAEKWEDEDEH